MTLQRPRHKLTHSAVLTLLAAVGGIGCSDDSDPAIVAPKISYEVPPGGGKVAVKTDSGNEVTLTFPASAAGKTIGLTPKSSADIGWADGRFSDVIELTPTGLQLSEPVMVHSKQNDLMVLHIEEANGKKTKPEMLPLAANGTDLELRHFSAIAFVPVAFSCDGSNGWKATASAAACQDAGAASTQLAFQCSARAYCVDVTSSCCVPPARANDGCRLGDAHLLFTVASVSNPSSQYPWCSDTNGTGGTHAGGAGSSATPSGGATSTAIGGTAANMQGGAPASGGTLNLGGTGMLSGGTLGNSNGGTTLVGGTTGSGGSTSRGGTGFGTGGTVTSGGTTNSSATGGTVASGGTASGSTAGAGTWATGGALVTSGGTSFAQAGSASTVAIAGGGTAGSATIGSTTAGAASTSTTNPQGGTAGATNNGAMAGMAGVAGSNDTDNTDGCLGWTDLGMPSGASLLSGVAAVNDSLVLAVGTSTTTSADTPHGVPIVATYDANAGTAWSTEIPTTAGALRAVWANSAEKSAVAVGNAGSVMIGHYLVTPASADWTWEYPAGGPTVDLYSVWGIDADHFVASGSGNAIYYYDANATNPWTNVAVPSNLSFGMVRGIWGTSIDDFWVVNAQGSCPGSNQWHFVSGTWTADSQGNGCYATNAIWGAAANDVWAVGYSKGAFSHYTGGNWSAATTYGLTVPLNMNGIRGRAANRIWAVGEQGSVAAYDGSNWKMCSKATTTDLHAVDVASQSVWAVGGTVLKRANVSPL